ncbi:16639_t:CDS:2 [Funneliformis geosporum]|uniref:3169_t:CDS:1 n=1 Tax=Funneliformis geosporum TaxID=1117311 RepID=A0A9W4WTN7_9GLOM|nr:16639_t:CDS:2 [Funneliformis geosporum]CAI2185141.1 3169_t:CDS:2 [Funneliformis geosporum]
MNSSPTKLSLEQLNNHYILFRHGQSKANSAKIVVSHPDNGIPSSGVGPPSPASFSSEGNGWGLTQLDIQNGIINNATLSSLQASQNMLNYLYNNFPSEHHQKKRGDDRNNEGFNNPSQNRFSLSKKFHIKIYSSPFLRTVETANILLKELLNNGPIVDVMVHPEVIVHDDLRERDFGIFELRSDHESYSKVWAIDESITTPSNKNEYKEIGVESCEQVRSRMCDVIREIEQQSELLKVVVLVSHGDSLQILQTAFENVEANLHRSLNHIGTAEWKVFWS